MKKQIFNSTHIEGYLYQHKLEKKVSSANAKNPNTTYIMGTVDLATDDEMTNIVSIHFTYVTAVTKDGKENRTFKTLAGIIDGTFPSVMKDGKQAAQKFVFNSNLDTNEFYSDRSGKVELVSAMRNEGGFISTVDALNEDEKARATFDTDIIIYKVTHVDEDPEKELPEKAIVHGYVMNFRKDFLPVKLSVLNKNAMAYFEDLEASERKPVFTRVRGNEVSTITVKRVEEEGAFGETFVREYPNSHKDYVINWAKKDPYEIGEDMDLTSEEIKKGLADRETALATKKADFEARKANKEAVAAPSAFANSAEEDFNF